VVFGSIPLGWQRPPAHLPLSQSLATLQVEPARDAPPELDVVPPELDVPPELEVVPPSELEVPPVLVPLSGVEPPPEVEPPELAPPSELEVPPFPKLGPPPSDVDPLAPGVEPSAPPSFVP
jgi:hypothetical protein